jgi:eukaryotic-like serine/threonine-protein kinase
MRDELPARIDRYEPLRRLAVGGMAEIFLAKQSGLEGFEKVVVIKRILPSLAQDQEFVQMFRDEARIAAKLSHPNIVQIYDLGKSDDTDYIAMEYVSGRNVQHMINKQLARGTNLPIEHCLRIIAGVCDGLHYAHSRKDFDGKPMDIVHRDISPQNILVRFDGGVKVVDFGIAKASTQLAQTRANVLKGKYAYMSPEQVKGQKIDHRSDLFSLGLVMYEMLTGVRAFERDNSLKTLKAIVQEKPINPREYNPDLPMEVIKLLSKALEKHPDRRYKNAQEFQLAVEDYLEVSPKKSNNVRLSRFMYDLFEDELNSSEGTLIVPGVGQVIIPTSQGASPAAPAISEDVDHRTLTAVLADDQPSPAMIKAATPAPSMSTSAPAGNKVMTNAGHKASVTGSMSSMRPMGGMADASDADEPEVPSERTMVSMTLPDSAELIHQNAPPPNFKAAAAAALADPAMTRPQLAGDDPQGPDDDVDEGPGMSTLAAPISQIAGMARATTTGEAGDEPYLDDEPADIATPEDALPMPTAGISPSKQYALLGASAALMLATILMVAVGLSGNRSARYGVLVVQGLPAGAALAVDNNTLKASTAQILHGGDHVLDVKVDGVAQQRKFRFADTEDYLELTYPFAGQKP